MVLVAKELTASLVLAEMEEHSQAGPGAEALDTQALRLDKIMEALEEMQESAGVEKESVRELEIQEDRDIQLLLPMVLVV